MRFTFVIQKMSFLILVEFFLSVLKFYLFTYLSEACNGIKSAYGSMKLYAAFLCTSNKLWVRNTSCFCQNCFGTSFKSETACSG